MYFMSNAKIKIFKQRLLNLDFALTQNEKFYFFFYHQYFSSQLLQYLKKNQCPEVFILQIQFLLFILKKCLLS